MTLCKVYFFSESEPCHVEWTGSVLKMTQNKDLFFLQQKRPRGDTLFDLLLLVLGSCLFYLFYSLLIPGSLVSSCLHRFFRGL